MNFSDYQTAAGRTAVYPDEWKGIYPVVGLGNEAGEVLGKLKKYMRGDRTYAETVDIILEEVGDCLWYCAMIVSDLGGNLDVVATNNIKKLLDRQERDVLKGDGDKR